MKDKIFVTNGVNPNVERQPEDYYATDPRAMVELLKLETFSPTVWECCAGEKHLSKVLEDAGYNVISSDIINRGGYKDFMILDFMATNENPYGDIITNPPYKYAREFVEHALNISPDGTRVAMFLKLTFLEGQKRKALFEKYPFKTLYVFSKRMKCAKDGNFDEIKSSAVAYGWYVWEKGYKGRPEIKWI